MPMQMKIRYLSVFFCHLTLFALPQNPTIEAGKASMHAKNGQANIICDDKTIIHWHDFSIAENEVVHFMQKNDHSSVLNRVITDNVSQILGKLQANGNFYLINPNGIVVGPNAEMIAATLSLSTLDVLDEEFLQGNKLTFSGSETGKLKIFGTLKAEKGDITLIGEKIENKGSLEAPYGTFFSGAGNQVVIERGKYRNSFFEVKGQKKEKLLHKGTIFAREMNSVSSGPLVMDGEFKASEKDGKIYLLSSNDLLYIDGKVESERGKVYLLGKDVQLGPAAFVDVSGEKAGEIYVGGGLKGEDPLLMNATTTHVDFGSFLTADGVGDADGGLVSVWGNRLAAFHGNISVRGGENSGNGGLAEISGEEVSFQGEADCRAPNGMKGDLILDPRDINITASFPTYNLATLTLTFNSPSAGATLSVSPSSIETQLGLGNVTLQANNDIEVRDNISPNPGDNGDLRLQAGANITIFSGVTITLQQSSMTGGNFHATVNDGGANPVQRANPNSPGLFSMQDPSSIVTNGGDIMIDTGNFNGSQNGRLLMESSSSLNATGGNGGNISIDIITNRRGAGDAIRMVGGTIQTDGAGTIDIEGEVVSASGSQRGFFAGLGTNNINTVNGNISISGSTGVGGNSLSNGIELGTFGSCAIQSSGSGAISLTGSTQSPNATATLIDREGTLQTTTGNITVIGTGSNANGISSNTDIITTGGSISLTGNTTNGAAIRLNPFGVITSSADDETITITGTVSSGAGLGVNITGQNITSSSANANAAPISITGIAGPSGFNTGFALREFNGPAAITANAADITIQGTATGTIALGASFDCGEVSTPGNISITGIGGSSGGSGNHGIRFLFGDTPITSSGGSISMTGTAGTGQSDGIVFSGGWTGTVDADTTLTVEGTGSSGGVGINVLGGILQCKDDLTLTASTTPSANAIVINDATVQCTASGDVTATVSSGSLAIRENGILQTTGTGALSCDINNNISLIAGANAATISINNGGSSADISLKAGQSISFLSPGVGDATLTNTGSGNVTLVCDNLFPTSPDFGTTGFIFNSVITTNGELRIYTVSPILNTINDPINGQNFVAGAFLVDSPTEQYGVYFPDGTYGGQAFNFYYKITPEEVMATEDVAINSLQLTQAQLTDLLPTLYNTSIMLFCEQIGNQSHCLQDPYLRFIRKPFFRR